jgi:hypothetical protein
LVRQFLTNEVAALSGFETVAKVAFPPLIGLIEMTDLYFVGLRMLRKSVAKGEVAVKTHELAKINIGDSRVTPNDEHILVIIGSGGLTKICRTGNYQWVGAQGIRDRKYSTKGFAGDRLSNPPF